MTYAEWLRACVVLVTAMLVGQTIVAAGWLLMLVSRFIVAASDMLVALSQWTLRAQTRLMRVQERMIGLAMRAAGEE